MKKLILIIPILAIVSCSNEVEEIVNPKTGTLLKRFEYYTDDSGQKIKDGDYIEWYADGSKKEESVYSSGILNGIQKTYDNSGTICELNFIMGKKEGNGKISDKNGVILNRFNYKNDMKDGIQESFNENGKIKLKADYEFGIPSNIWTYYDSEGEVIAKLKFINGICQDYIGRWKILQRKGFFLTFKDDGSVVLEKPQSSFSPVNDGVMVGEFEMEEELNIYFVDQYSGIKSKTSYPILVVSNKLDTIDFVNFEYQNSDDMIMTIVKIKN